MEGGRREESKLSLPLVDDIIVLLYESHLKLVKRQTKLHLNLASNSLQNPYSGKAVNNNNSNLAISNMPKDALGVRKDSSEHLPMDLPLSLAPEGP